MTPERRKAVRKLRRSRKEKYVLRLYVTGLTPNSTRAITNAKAFCEKHLQGRYDLQIIDLYQRPKLAKGEQIIAAPTLIKKLPLPLRRLVGDLSQEANVLLGLDLRPELDQTGDGATQTGSPRTE
jgi:circadian clock protein KaiB